MSREPPLLNQHLAAPTRKLLLMHKCHSSSVFACSLYRPPTCNSFLLTALKLLSVHNSSLVATKIKDHPNNTKNLNNLLGLMIAWCLLMLINICDWYVRLAVPIKMMNHTKEVPMFIIFLVSTIDRYRTIISGQLSLKLLAHLYYRCIIVYQYSSHHDDLRSSYRCYIWYRIIVLGSLFIYYQSWCRNWYRCSWIK